MDLLLTTELQYRVVPYCDACGCRMVPSDNVPLATNWAAWACPQPECTTMAHTPLLSEATDA